MHSKLRVLVVSDRDPWRHRRTREVTRMFADAGCAVQIAASPEAHVARHVPVHSIGPAARTRFRLPRGIKRYLARVLFTALATFAPSSSSLRWFAGILLWARLTEGLRELLRTQQFDIIVVEDLMLLPAVLAEAGSARVIFDSREHYCGHFDHLTAWRWLIRPGYSALVRNFLPLCDGVTAISEAISQKVRDASGVTVLSVRNVPSRPPSMDSVMRRATEVETRLSLRLVYHGASQRVRGLERLIEAADILGPSVDLKLYLVGRKRSIARIERAARGVANCAVLPPVDFQDIPSVLRDHDVGVAFFPPASSNLALALPSKFFEYLSAGLPVAVGPSPSMVEIIEEFQCGVVAESFEPGALAEALGSVTRDRLCDLRAGARRAGQELVASREYKKFAALVDDLGG